MEKRKKIVATKERRQAEQSIEDEQRDDSDISLAERHVPSLIDPFRVEVINNSFVIVQQPVAGTAATASTTTVFISQDRFTKSSVNMCIYTE